MYSFLELVSWGIFWIFNLLFNSKKHIRRQGWFLCKLNHEGGRQSDESVCSTPGKWKHSSELLQDCHVHDPSTGRGLGGTKRGKCRYKMPSRLQNWISTQMLHWKKYSVTISFKSINLKSRFTKMTGGLSLPSSLLTYKPQVSLSFCPFYWYISLTQSSIEHIQT